jgi:hypothetical protein
LFFISEEKSKNGKRRTVTRGREKGIEGNQRIYFGALPSRKRFLFSFVRDKPIHLFVDSRKEVRQPSE